MKKYFRYLRLVSGVCASVLVLSTFVQVTVAQPLVVPTLNLNAPGLQIAGSHAADQAAFQQRADGTWELKTPGGVHYPGAPWLTVQELNFLAADPISGPLIYGNMLVQNNTAALQTYTVGFTLPTTFPGPNLIRGSVDTSIIGTDGTISALANSSIYSAQIDFLAVRTLQGFPFTLSTTQSANSSSAQFGFDLNNAAVTSSIGILLQFQLSPGDTAAIISDFQVVAVPEPSSMALLLAGGALLIWRRRS